MQPLPNPSHIVTDQDRQVMIHHVQRAMSQDLVKFEEIDDRFEAIYRAQTRAELDLVVADLPMPPAPAPVPVSHPLPSQSLALMGDVKVGGWIAVDSDLTYGTLMGDIVVDLSSGSLPERLTITCWNIFGDTTVILPDGVRASLGGFVALGDRKVDLTPPQPGSPTVIVKAYKLAGDAKIYSLSRVPEGRLRKLWQKLRS